MTHRRLPAEWEEQSGVMITWPHSKGDWKTNFETAEETFLNIAAQVSLNELILVVCADKQTQNSILEKLPKINADPDNFRFAIVDSNDTWARDHGPITVLENNNPLLLDFQFNGWGNKHPSDLDNQISIQLANNHVFGKKRLETIDFILEGGSIESDGNGTLLTTRHCLLNSSRNGTLNQQQIEDALCEYLGINRILWLSHGGLSGDDTDSHIDTLARYCDKNTITYVECTDHNDEHFEKLTAMHDELLKLRGNNNKPYKLVPLPLPSAKYNDQGKRLPATYANFLIMNRAVLVPTYDDHNDDIALNTLQKCFPERRIIGINCNALIEQFGSLHCITMQFPKNVLF